ncbi:ATP-binding cassette domain-containing protein [Paenibacillus humicola]|uniref:ATP-binding cassette domain-containing protein n=1 Tax=Paenibacillus humicola TaxID=3110540 RepID=UPI00237C2525|nr:ATP-binding cassette domain-containing protein [Paenibacillus humicola]
MASPLPSKAVNGRSAYSVPERENGLELEIREGTVRFGEKTVLDRVSLRIRPGEFLAVAGRSGSGKSTLLRLIAGLEKSEAEAVFFDGALSSGLRSDVRFMFQEARLLPWKTVLDNVRIGVPGGDRGKALVALQFVGLDDRAGEWPAVLSGGQRQRVALARAIAGSPRLLLLDEPLGALDALTRIEMQQLIERLWIERRFTAVLVTHDISEAVALADRVAVVEQGAITFDVPVALARPRERDGGFAQHEKLILNRVMTRGKQERESVRVL